MRAAGRTMTSGRGNSMACLLCNSGMPADPPSKQAYKGGAPQLTCRQSAAGACRPGASHVLAGGRGRWPSRRRQWALSTPQRSPAKGNDAQRSQQEPCPAGIAAGEGGGGGLARCCRPKPTAPLRCLHSLLALPEHKNTPLQPHLVVLAHHLAHQRLSRNLSGRHVPPSLDHGFGAGEAAAVHHKLLGVRQGVRLRGQEA